MTRHRHSRERRAVGRAAAVIADRSSRGISKVVDHLADDYDVSQRTLYRWLAESAEIPADDLVDRDAMTRIDPWDKNQRTNPVTGKVTLTGFEMTAVASHAGNVKMAWETLVADDETDLTYSQFWRRYSNLEPDLQEALRHGVKAQAAMLAYTGWTVARPFEMIALDHTSFPIKIVDGDGEYDAWGTFAVEPYFGIMPLPIPTYGLGIKGDPQTEATREMILRIVRGFEMVDPETGEVRWWGGVPEMVLTDNGSANNSKAMQAGFVSLGTKFHAGPAYESTYNGPAERAIQTWKNRLKGLPGSTKAPKGLRDVNHHSNSPLVLTPEQFAELLEDIWFHHNFETVNPRTGLTPCQAFMQSSFVPDQVDVAVVARMFSNVTRRYVRNGKVTIDYDDFTAPELRTSHLHNVRVEVRFLPNDRSFVEVFVDDEWLCTAYRVDDMSLDEKGAVANARRARLNNTDKIFKAGASMSTHRVAKRLGLPAPDTPPRRGRKPSAPAIATADINDLFQNTGEAS